MEENTTTVRQRDSPKEYTTYAEIANLVDAAEGQQFLIQIARDEIDAAAALCHGLNNGTLIGANNVVLVAQIGIIESLVGSAIEIECLLHRVRWLRIAYVAAALLLRLLCIPIEYIEN